MQPHEDARPLAGEAGTPQAGETCRQSTHTADIPARDVPWIRRRGGDPVVIRRRIAAALDDLLGIERTPGWADLDYDGDYYRDGGLHLGVVEREVAAPAPLVCAA